MASLATGILFCRQASKDFGETETVTIVTYATGPVLVIRADLNKALGRMLTIGLLAGGAWVVIPYHRGEIPEGYPNMLPWIPVFILIVGLGSVLASFCSFELRLTSRDIRLRKLFGSRTIPIGEISEVERFEFQGRYSHGQMLLITSTAGTRLSFDPGSLKEGDLARIIAHLARHAPWAFIVPELRALVPGLEPEPEPVPRPPGGARRRRPPASPVTVMLTESMPFVAILAIPLFLLLLFGYLILGRW